MACPARVVLLALGVSRCLDEMRLVMKAFKKIKVIAKCNEAWSLSLLLSLFCDQGKKLRKTTNVLQMLVFEKGLDSKNRL